MSTQIKKNGNWVTVAGGTRMWVGTKAALQAALDAGELVDSTAVMVTDDYEDADHLHPDWANAVSITAAQLNAGYTAPSDGMFVGRWVNSSSAGAEMTINNVAVGVASNNTSGMLQCPVSSGDVIKNNGTTGTSGISFVPWK